MGFIGAEGETRQGDALSMLRKISLYVRATLPLANRRTWTKEFSSLYKNLIKRIKPKKSGGNAAFSSIRSFFSSAFGFVLSASCPSFSSALLSP
jgi:hypothetical protein